MNKGKVILFSVIGLLLCITIGVVIYIFSANKKDSSEIATTPPLLSTKDSLTYKDMLSNTNVTDYTEHKSKDSTALTHQIASIYGVGNTGENRGNENNTPTEKSQGRTTYNPYGNRSMYVVPNNIKRDPVQYPSVSNNYNYPENTGGYTQSQREANDEKLVYYTNKSANSTDKLVKAQIIGNQKVTQTQPYAKIRLLEAMQSNGVVIPSGTKIMAKCNFDAARVYLTITAVEYNNKLVPVKAKIYDLYGVEGLSVKGGTGAEVSNEANTMIGESVGDQTEEYVKGSKRLVNKIFKANPKAILNGDNVFLKLEK